MDLDVDINQNASIYTQNNGNIYRTKENHTVAIILGYILIFLVPLLGLICAIYLLTRDNEDAHDHGLIILVLGILLMFIGFLIYFIF